MRRGSSEAGIEARGYYRVPDPPPARDGAATREGVELPGTDEAAATNLALPMGPTYGRRTVATRESWSALADGQHFDRPGSRGVRPCACPAATIAGNRGSLLRLVYDPWYLNYDARYALLWAGDLWHGFRPDYGTPFAPTPHPLQTAVGFLRRSVRRVGPAHDVDRAAVLRRARVARLPAGRGAVLALGGDRRRGRRAHPPGARSATRCSPIRTSPSRR